MAQSKQFEPAPGKSVRCGRKTCTVVKIRKPWPRPSRAGPSCWTGRWSQLSCV